jgi:hypothetical protein
VRSWQLEKAALADAVLGPGAGLEQAAGMSADELLQLLAD